MSQDTHFENATVQHLAVIMDGNGRWAKKRNLPRTAGHKQGIEASKRTVRAAIELGIPYLTLFGFSSENWNRPQGEITDLMGLLRLYLKSETADLHKNGIKLNVIGLREMLDDDICELIDNARNLTAQNTKLNLTIALNYGGRQEIVKAVEGYVAECVEAGEKPNFEDVHKDFPGFLMTKDMPDPDILIRTSGEQRLSNFLLWQCAYTELFFTETLWPDFSKTDIEKVMADYTMRDRRFGGVTSAESKKK